MAITVDEGGLVAGLVTVQYLVEELVSEIASGHEHSPELVVLSGGGCLKVQGGASVRDINRALGANRARPFSVEVP
ncbi:MAG: hypothetical protein IRZ16_21870, partial [Myxococcaceae bacterium]|nr:hypothetical protein [Myxococcaceae bacterium]